MALRTEGVVVVVVGGSVVGGAVVGGAAVEGAVVVGVVVVGEGGDVVVDVRALGVVVLVTGGGAAVVAGGDVVPGALEAALGSTVNDGEGERARYPRRPTKPTRAPLMTSDDRFIVGSKFAGTGDDEWPWLEAERLEVKPVNVSTKTPCGLYNFVSEVVGSTYVHVSVIQVSDEPANSGLVDADLIARTAEFVVVPLAMSDHLGQLIAVNDVLGT